KYDGKFVDGRRPIKIELITDGASARQETFGCVSIIKQAAAAARIAANANASPSTNTQVPVAPRRRVKKGPKRLKKHIQKHKTAEELDKEMEDYRAAAVEV
ncbi:hypothetical protein MPER_15161, partial [Moniliophthora perniciosa FA553]